MASTGVRIEPISTHELLSLFKSHLALNRAREGVAEASNPNVIPFAALTSPARPLPSPSKSPLSPTKPLSPAPPSSSTTATTRRSGRARNKPSRFLDNADDDEPSSLSSSFAHLNSDRNSHYNYPLLSPQQQQRDSLREEASTAPIPIEFDRWEIEDLYAPRPTYRELFGDDYEISSNDEIDEEDDENEEEADGEEDLLRNRHENARFHSSFYRDVDEDEERPKKRARVQRVSLIFVFA